MKSQDLRFMGIDSSLNSTGVCVGQGSLSPEFLAPLSFFLFDVKTPDDTFLPPSYFSNFYKILFEAEIKPNKNIIKDLEKTRKEIRNSPKSSENLYFYENLLEIQRMTDTIEKILEIVREYKPHFIHFEDYAFAASGSSGLQLAELKGILRYRLFQMYKENDKIFFGVVPIVVAKKIASTSGSASKDFIREGMKRFGFEGYEKKNDQLDAIAISLTVFYTLYFKVNGLNFDILPDKSIKDRQKKKKWIDMITKFGYNIPKLEE